MKKQIPFRRKTAKDRNLTVKKADQLLNFLIAAMPEKSRSEIKSFLSHRQIVIDGKVVTAFDHPLKVNDTVSVRAIGEEKPNPNHKVRIVFEDEHLLIVDKKNGVLTMSTGKEDEQTAYTVMMEHVRRRHRNNRIFIVHRLDRETSGLLIFAKSEEAQFRLQHNWNENIIKRAYVAVVEGVPDPHDGTIKNWLLENRKSLKMHSSPTDNGGKLAITHYRTLKHNGQYTLLELNLETGRKNQIRVHMSDLGTPIAGDKKYGAASNPLGRICLHARSLVFKHPFTFEMMSFDTGIPKNFK